MEEISRSLSEKSRGIFKTNPASTRGAILGEIPIQIQGNSERNPTRRNPRTMVENPGGSPRGIPEQTLEKNPDGIATEI